MGFFLMDIKSIHQPGKLPLSDGHNLLSGDRAPFEFMLFQTFVPETIMPMP